MVIDFSVSRVCVSPASDVLGVCVVITPALKLCRLGRFLGRFSIGWYLLPYLQVRTGLDSVLRRPIPLGYKELLCAAEHTLRHRAPQSIPY